MSVIERIYEQAKHKNDNYQVISQFIATPMNGAFNDN